MRLAIQGGRAIRKSFLPYARQLIEEEDVNRVVEVLRSDWLTTGPKVEQYEEAFASWVGSKYAVAFSSGTAALHAAVFAAGIGPGAEAITTPLTFVATANAVLYQGARPVFADIEADTLNINTRQIIKKISARTKALIPVDFAGQPADLDEINKIASRHGLVVIEDAAHSLGARYKSRKVGTLATMTVFSTHPIKHITTGEGGMVTTNHSRLVRQLRLFRNHGIVGNGRDRQRNGSWFYEMVALGYNYRITDIQCALGLSQLSKLGSWLARRHQIAAKYNQALAGLEELQTPVVRVDRESAWHLYVIRLNFDKLRAGRSKIFKALHAEKIGVNVHYIPVPWHPYYQGLKYKKGKWPVAERAYEQLISLPMFHAMTDRDVNDVIEAVRKVLTFYQRKI